MSARPKAPAHLTPEDRAALQGLDRQGWWQVPQVREPMQEPLLRAAAYYYLRAKNRRGLPQDAVARFHLGNGARLERLNWLADGSDNGITQSHGLMVNYLYDLDDIEKNHEAYAEGRRVVASNGVRRLMRGRGGRACASDRTGLIRASLRSVAASFCGGRSTRPP